MFRKKGVIDRPLGRAGIPAGPSISRYARPSGDVSLTTLAFMRFGIQIDERLGAPESPAH